MELPASDTKLINETRRQYEALARQGSPESSQAGCSYCWALVHSKQPSEVKQGITFCEGLLSAQDLPQHKQHELLYYIAVAKYKLGKHIEARNQLRTLLEVDPDMRQAKALLEHLETTIAKEALIGVGIGATGLLGLGALVVGALLSRR